MPDGMFKTVEIEVVEEFTPRFVVWQTAVPSREHPMVAGAPPRLAASNGKETVGLLGDGAQSCLVEGASRSKLNTLRVSLTCALRDPLWAVTVKVELVGLIPAGNITSTVRSLSSG